MQRIPFRSLMLILASGLATPALHAAALSNPPQAPANVGNAPLAKEISTLFQQDQDFLARLDHAKKDPAFKANFLDYRNEIEAKDHLFNFADAYLYQLWSADPAAPEIVREYVAFRTASDARVKAIADTIGWPRRGKVGDEAAAQYLFLFGHADLLNAWRLTHRKDFDILLHEDHLNPRVYAHFVDRLEDMAGRPQICGSIMGPGPQPGTAKLYWPLVDSEAAADRRRAAIGLPSIATDMATFRAGADIGPYMRPMSKGDTWTIADVWAKP